MSKEKLPEHKLQALWRALDPGNSGSISCQEWLPFVKRGAAALQAADRAREQALKAEKRRLLRNEEVEQFKAASRKAEAATRAIEQETRKLEALLIKKSRSLPSLDPRIVTSFVTQGGMGVALMAGVALRVAMRRDMGVCHTELPVGPRPVSSVFDASEYPVGV